MDEMLISINVDGKKILFPQKKLHFLLKIIKKELPKIFEKIERLDDLKTTNHLINIIK